MNITGLDHIGIPTNDFEASEKFYRELGFELIGDFPMGERHFKFYQIGDLIVELVPADERNAVEGAVSHFAVRCDSADEAYAFCREKGYTILGDRGPGVIPFWENGAKCFNILGPNGEKIEFCEIL